MSIIANADDVAVTSRTILMTHYYKTGVNNTGCYSAASATFCPDYSIFQQEHEQHPAILMAQSRGVHNLVSKEEVGNNRCKGTEVHNECTFRLYPDNLSLINTKPVFTFREPVDCFSSWKKLGWNDIFSFILAYQNVFTTYQMAKRLRPETIVYKFEDLTSHPATAKRVFQTICADWGLSFSPAMLSMKAEFAQNFLFWHPIEERIYCQDNPKGIFSTLREFRSIVKPESHRNLVSSEEATLIERELSPLYDSIDTRNLKRVNC